MNIIPRIKNMITTPKTEWAVVSTEVTPSAKLLTAYVLPLVAAAALAAFIGYGFVGRSTFGVKITGLNWGIYQALMVLISGLLSVYISAFVVDALAPTFKSEKNFDRSFQLVAYSLTPVWVGGLLAIVPMISFLGALFGLYGIYLWYLGLKPIKQTSDDNRTVYLIVSILVLILVYGIVFFALGSVFMRIFGLNMINSMGGL